MYYVVREFFGSFIASCVSLDPNPSRFGKQVNVRMVSPESDDPFTDRHAQKLSGPLNSLSIFTMRLKLT